MPGKVLPSLKTRLLVSAVGIAVFAAAWAARPLLQQRGALLFEAKVQGCLPWQLYWYDKQQEKRPLQRGDIILFPARGMAPVIADGQPIGKMVVGLPGDEVRITEGNVYINGGLIADVRYGAAKLGKPPTFWDKTYRLDRDEVFVFGSEQHSWDSRYWGPYPLSMVRGRLVPVF